MRFFPAVLLGLGLSCRSPVEPVDPGRQAEDPGVGTLEINGSLGGSVFSHWVAQGPWDAGVFELDLTLAQGRDWYFSEPFWAAANGVNLQDSEGVGYDLGLEPGRDFQLRFLRVLHAPLRPGWHTLDLPVAMFRDDLLWNRHFTTRVADFHRFFLRAESRPLITRVTRRKDGGTKATYSVGASEAIRFTNGSVQVTDLSTGSSVACTGVGGGPLMQQPEGVGRGVTIHCPAAPRQLRFELFGFFATSSGLPLTDLMGGAPVVTVDWQGDQVDRQGTLDTPGAQAVWVDRRVPPP